MKIKVYFLISLDTNDNAAGDLAPCLLGLNELVNRLQGWLFWQLQKRAENFL